ncbi:hypothetical protein [Actinomadura alba]|nr:hypothetical protein [Actinomadura alba]
MSELAEPRIVKELRLVKARPLNVDYCDGRKSLDEVERSAGC